MRKNQLVKNASYASVAAGSLILIIKVLGFLNSSSASIFASFIDSMLDVSSSLVNMLAISASLIPADDKHRFGHHKIQDLAIFSQSIVFILSGIFTASASIYRFFIDVKIQNQETAAMGIIVCIGITFLLVMYQSYVIKETNSQIIKSDRIHYISDFASNIVVIISLLISQKFYFIDNILGVIIALYIIISAIRLLKHSMKNLIDEEFSDLEKEKILKILRNNHKVLDIHELKTRYAGDKAFIQFHIELDPNTSLIKAHEISEEIELQLQEIFKDSEIIIHQDPSGYDREVKYKENLRKKIP